MLSGRSEPRTQIAPHGGQLVDLLADPARGAELEALARGAPSWDLTARQLCDLELLACGGFSPLRGFHTRADYERVLTDLRLADGAVWPIPVTLDVPDAVGEGLATGTLLVLRDPEGVPLAVMHVEDVWRPDRDAEAAAVYGTEDAAHPGVAALWEGHAVYVGGSVEVLRRPVHYDHRDLRHSPAELRAVFARAGWERVVAFQTRNPVHRAHQELTHRAAEMVQAKLLIHPVVGMTRPGDVDHYTRVRCYRAVLGHYPADSAMLSLLPLAMRMAGPREAVWHAVIRKNYGCTHLIVGRDHAGPGVDGAGRPFYGPYEAQDLLRHYEAELGVAMVPFASMVYLPSERRYVPEGEVPEGAQVQTLSGTELRRRLARGEELPAWFTFPEVAAELRRRYPPRTRQGVTVLFTGLSGAGKSTIANVLMVKLLERGDRAVTLLDGDIVRKHLSAALGFSKRDRDTNIRRIGFVAAEITRNGGVALCAPIAPYDAVRKEVRRMVQAVGGFVLVHVATPLEVCESRDRKGLYARARAGEIQNFTGVSDPYEEPADAEVVLNGAHGTPEDLADRVMAWLDAEGYLEPLPNEG